LELPKHIPSVRFHLGKFWVFHLWFVSYVAYVFVEPVF